MLGNVNVNGWYLQVRAVSESFSMAKDAGFKVVAHMMPDLPNVDIERDIEQFIVSYTFIYNRYSIE